MLTYNEQRQYLKDQAYIQAEREIVEMEIWEEWQDEMKQKPAKIVVVEEKVKTHDRDKTYY